MLQRTVTFLIVSILWLHSAIAKTGMSLITGSIDLPIAGNVGLFKVQDGETVNTASYEFRTDERKFVFAVPESKAGWYYLMLNAKAASAEEKEMPKKVGFIPVYVKAGESITVKLSFDSQEPGLKDYHVVNASAENQALESWVKKASPLVTPWRNLTAVDVEAYVMTLKQLQPSLRSHIRSMQVAGNPGFTKALKAMATVQLDFALPLMYHYQKSWQQADETATLKTQLDKSYKQLASFCAPAVIVTGMGSELGLLYDDAYAFFNEPLPATAGAEKKLERVGAVINGICNDTLKGYYCARKLQGISKISAEAFQEQMAVFKPYLVLGYMQDAYKHQLAAISGIKQQGETTQPATPWANVEAAPTSGIAFIHGVIHKAPVQNNIMLLATEYGNTREICKQRLGNDNASFVLAAYISKPGMYQLQCGNLKFRVFLKPNDRLEMNINGQAADEKIPRSYFSYDLVTGSAENKLLEQWFHLSLPVTVHGVSNRIIGNDNNLAVFEQQFQRLKLQAPAFLASAKNMAPGFYTLLQQAVQIDLEYSALLYLAYLTDKVRYSLPNDFPGYKTVQPPFDSIVEPRKFCDASLSNFSEGRDYVVLYNKWRLAWLQQQGKTPSVSERLPWILEGICNDTIRAMVAEKELASKDIVNLSEFNEKFSGIQPFLATPGAQKKYQEAYSMFAADTIFLGKPVLPVLLPDSSGNMVDLKQFAGKVIFIDTWATWCGPCKEQLPFLKALEADYHKNEDIVFVGISIDRGRDKEKWKKMIRTQQLPGIQLFDDTGKQFKDPMQIEAIPRFLLIDKKGNWIEVRCPKPDQKERLKRLVDAALIS